MTTRQPLADEENWVLQVCQRTFSQDGQHYSVWRTTSRPLGRASAMKRLRERQEHKKPHRILTGVTRALIINSLLLEVSA